MSDSEYNDPFYFAVPRGAKLADVRAAVVHIAKTFRVRGRVVPVRREPGYTLLRIESAS